MGTPNVNITVTAQQAQVINMWLQTNQSLSQFINLMNQAGNAGQQAGQKTAGGVQTMVGSLGQAAMQFAGISSSVGAIYTTAQLLNRELEAIRQYTRLSEDTSVSYGQAKARIIGQMPRDLGMSADQIMEQLVQHGRGQPIEALAEEFIAAMSTAGAAPGPERMENFLAVMKNYSQESAETRKQMIVGLSMLRQSYGGTATEQLGTFASGLTASPSNDPGKFAQYFASGAAQMQAYGYTEKEAFQTLLALQSRSGDVNAAVSSRAGLNMARQLQEEMVGAVNKFNRPELAEMQGAERERFIRKKDDPAAIYIRQHLLGAMMKSAKESATEAKEEWSDEDDKTITEILGLGPGQTQKRAKLMAKLRTRAQTFVAMMEYLQTEGMAEGPMQSRALGETLIKQVEFGPRAEQFLEEKQARMDADPQMMAWRLKQEEDRTKMRLHLDSAAAIREKRRKFAEEQWVASGGSATIGRLRGWGMALSPVGTQAEELEAYAKDIQYRVVREVTGEGPTPISREDFERAYSKAPADVKRRVQPLLDLQKQIIDQRNSIRGANTTRVREMEMGTGGRSAAGRSVLNKLRTLLPDETPTREELDALIAQTHEVGERGIWDRPPGLFSENFPQMRARVRRRESGEMSPDEAASRAMAEEHERFLRGIRDALPEAVAEGVRAGMAEANGGGVQRVEVVNGAVPQARESDATRRANAWHHTVPN